MRFLRYQLSAVLFALVLALTLGSGTHLLAERQRPTFETLENLVRQFFTRAGNPQKPQLITQSQVHNLLEELRGMHIQISGRHQIARTFPHDKEFFSRFVLSELAHDPADHFPADPTFLFQRIDAMCTSHTSLRHFMILAGKGKTFEADWVSREPLFPPLEGLVTQDLLEAHGLLNADQASPRRRNYTVDHLLEILRASYSSEQITASDTNSLDALGR